MQCSVQPCFVFPECATNSQSHAAPFGLPLAVTIAMLLCQHLLAVPAQEFTNYHFEVAPAHLEGALDRFAQFFVAPLFKVRRRLKQQQRCSNIAPFLLVCAAVHSGAGGAAEAGAVALCAAAATTLFPCTATSSAT